MSKIRLLLELDIPPNEPPAVPEPYKCASLESKIKDYLDVIDSGEESKKEWEVVRKINNILMNKSKLNKKQKRILDMIQPMIEKYGMMDAKGVEQDPVKKSEIKHD